MKTYIPTVKGSTCPYCSLDAADERNVVTVLNMVVGDTLVECVCGERYFITKIPGDTDGS